MPEACGEDFDAHDFGCSNGRKDDGYHCSRCKQPIAYCLPWPTGEWRWEIPYTRTS